MPVWMMIKLCRDIRNRRYTENQALFGIIVLFLGIAIAIYTNL